MTRRYTLERFPADLLAHLLHEVAAHGSAEVLVVEEPGRDFGPHRDHQRTLRHHVRGGDELFFRQIREEAVADQALQQAATAKPLDAFRLVFDKALEGQ